MPKSTRISRTPADWQNLIDGQRNSGLSVRNYCKQYRIGDQSFYQWRKRLSGKEIETQSSHLIDITSVMNEVALLDSKQSWRIELDLGGGIKLNLSQH